MKAPATLDARHALLAGLIDHAPMFPPAKLPLQEALVDHASALVSEAAWLVNRFVVPASHLAHLPLDAPLRLSVVVDSDPAPDERIEALELTHALALQEDAPLDVAPDADIFIEHPWDEDHEDWLHDLMVGTDYRVKLRCGGTVVPGTAELARAIALCRETGLAFKATAGLHHAIRTEREHGFLNLLAAVVFGDEENALEETDASAFTLDSSAFRWHDRAATAEDVARARRDLFVSIGSCSFDEPVGELRALGFL